MQQGQPELKAIFQQVDVAVLGQVSAQLQDRTKEREQAFTDCAKALHDEDESGEDGAAEHVVAGALLPEDGQVVQQS